MTVLTDQVDAIAGADPDTVFAFAAVALRSNSADNGIITTVPRYYTADSTGTLTTDDLDPGPAYVTIANTQYSITIPDSSTPVALWPLIAAGLDT